MFLGFSDLYGQVVVKSSIDSSSIIMGDQTIVHLSVSQPSNMAVQFPVLGDELIKGINIVNISGDTIVDGNLIKINQDITITSFTPGSYVIPAFVCNVSNKSFQSNDLKITIRDVNAQFEEGHLPADIKPIFFPSFPIYAWIILFVGFFLFIISCFGGFIYWRKHRSDPEPYVRNNAVELATQPEVTALDMIRKLGEEKMWLIDGQEKKFFTILGDILRQYFYRLYHIPAMEMTSSELFSALYKQSVSISVRDKVQHIFITGDMTKFAKHKPTNDECVECINMAENIISETKSMMEDNVEKVN